MLKEIKILFSLARITLLKWRHHSDYRSWAGHSMLSPDWEARTKSLATFIPQGRSVIEFGAGRRTLKKYLDPHAQYTPCDFVDRGEGTLIVDLNKPLPVFPKHDIAVFGGVLEYVIDVPELVSHLAKYFDVVIASYVPNEAVPRKIIRRSWGWVNDYNQAQFEKIFLQNGYICDLKENWEEQKIYKFVRKNTQPGT